MIELPKGSVVKPYPATRDTGLKLATATSAFFLITFLLAGNTDEIQTALPVSEDATPIYSEAPDDEEIDYEELLNRIPLRKPTPEPLWLDWSSEKKRLQEFG